MIEEGLALVVNGQPHRLRGLVLATAPTRLPQWTADVDGSLATHSTLEGAIRGAAQAANSLPDPSPQGGKP